MKSATRSALTAGLALAMSACLGTPSSAQLESLEKKYGPFNGDVAGALNNLALLYADVGRDGEAEPLCKRAIAIQEMIGGLNSPAVATELNNLAALYQRQERYGEAEPLFKRALAIREQALGRDHPDVGQSLNNLATLCDKLDRHADSEPLFKRALVVYEKAAGPEHPAVATLLNNLGQVARVQGRYAEAEPEILLVSHGAVDSQAATKLTIATFDRLKVDPKIGRAEALRQAMLSYLNDASIAQKCLSRFLGTVRPDR